MSTSKSHKAPAASHPSTKGKAKLPAKSRPAVHHKARGHRPVLVAFLVVISLVLFGFTLLKIVDASRVDSYRDCVNSRQGTLLETNPPLCLMPDGSSYSWRP